MGWSKDHGRQRRTSETRNLQALKEAGKLFHLTCRVVLDSLQLPPMGLLLGRQELPMGLLLGPQLGPSWDCSITRVMFKQCIRKATYVKPMNDE